MTTPLRALAYTRVSTEEQAASGLGLDAQARTIAAAVEARGWTLSATYTDEGRSAATMRRPELLAALEALDRGEADVLVVSRLDRLSRSLLDFARITDRARRAGWSVVALDVDVDTTSPTGELTMNVAASVAQWERRIIAARTSDALQAARSRGRRLGRPVTLPQALRDRIAAEHAAGESLNAIARTLNAEGVPTARGGRWHASTVSAVLASLRLDRYAAAVREADLAGASA